MKKKILHMAFVALLLTLPTLVACSKEEKELTAKEKIDKMTDKVAAEAVEKIRTPLQKARDMANKGDEHLEKIQKELEKGQ